MSNDALQGLLIYGGGLIVAFLILREVFCWYGKVNERVALLKEIRDQLVQLSASSAAPTLAVEGLTPTAVSAAACPSCGASVTDEGSAFCEECGASLK